MTTPQDKRAAAIKATERREISQRRACRLVNVDPKTVSRNKEPESRSLECVRSGGWSSSTTQCIFWKFSE